jgi:S-adenosylmethionine decarboxylase
VLPTLGTESLVDAYGCSAAALRSVDVLNDVFARVVHELDLHPVATATWHVFPGAGGVTGMLMLSESHLACHTFPETGLATFDLYCCRPREPWAWEARLGEALGATRVVVRLVPRGEP